MCRFCTVRYCEERKPTDARRNGKVLGSLKSMNIGQELTFTYHDVPAITCAMSLLKKQFDTKFNLIHDDDKVHVKRIK